MKAIFDIHCVVQVDREVAKFKIVLGGQEPVPFLRVKVMEELGSDSARCFTAWGELRVRRDLTNGIHPFFGTGASIEKSLQDFLRQFDDQLKKLREIHGRPMKESDYEWLPPGEF